MNQNNFGQIYSVFDVLVLNAGILLPKEAKTVDGLEPTFQVNFLGHFLLCEGIIAHQRAKMRPLRVVSLTSVMHRLVGPVFPVEKEPTKWEQMFGEAKRWKAYALSKFATALLAQYLANNEQNKDQKLISAIAVHPGAVRTQMADCAGINPRIKKFLFFLKRIMIQPVRIFKGHCFFLETKKFQFLKI